MDKLQRDWAELKRQTLMSPVHLRSLPFSSNSANKLPLTSLRWRLYLDILPIESFGHEDDDCKRVWYMAIEKERINYTALRKQFIIDPNAVSESSNGGDGVEGNNVDWERMNPLSLDEDSPWQKYHRDQELRITIMQDVARTFPEHAYFRSQAVQRLMADILFVYAKIHTNLQYRQGMHELLAPLLMAVDLDSVDADGHRESSGLFLTRILDKKFVEHDAFALFDRLMRICTPWYQAPGIISPPLRTARNRADQFATSTDSPVDGTGRRASWRRQSIENARAQTPIISQCYLMMEKLALVDPELASHLVDLEIEPQLFGIRWYRLLFSREFTDLKDIFALWDVLFADNTLGLLKLVDWVCVVILLANRRRLLQGDYSDCLSILLHIPPLPKPSPDTLDRTPSLPNSPLPPQTAIASSPPDTLAMDLVPRLPLSALTLSNTIPVQRLAIQAGYLRSRPTNGSAKLIVRQYELWEDEAWDIVDNSDSNTTDKDSAFEKATTNADAGAGADASEQKPAAAYTRANNSRISPGNIVSSALWQGRKRYTSSTLQQMRTSGGLLGSTSPKMLANSLLSSPSPVLLDSAATGTGSKSPKPEERKASFVFAEDDGRTPSEAIRTLGSLTAQVSSIAAQCLDLALKQQQEQQEQQDTANSTGAHLSTIGAALYTVSRVWQDEVVRSSASEGGSPFNASATSADCIRPREISEADMRAVLRDLDNAYIALSKP